MQQDHLTASESRNWRNIFFIISALLVVIMPWLSRDYGQSGDEWLQIEYGQHIWNYFFNGDSQALNYDSRGTQYVGQQFYGGLFDFTMEIFHRWFPSIPILILRHFFNALSGAFMMIFTGLFVYRLSRKWSVGLIALLFIIFSPRIFGESMNNPKDIPVGCGFIIGCYYWLALLQDLPKRAWRNAIGIAIGFGITFGVRSAAGLLLGANFVVMTAIYYLVNHEFRALVTADSYKLAKKAILAGVVGIIGGYIIGLLAWPWGLESPISHPYESLVEMSNRSVKLPVLFEGIVRTNNMQPWYYELKWIVISNPLIVILCAALFIVLFAVVKKTYGRFALFFLLFAAFFTPLYMIYKKSSVHDTWRHLFFIYPFWVSMAALGLSSITRIIKHEKAQYAPIAIAILGLLPAIIWTFRTHPNQYVYFNESIGGINNALGYYDIDYYQNSGLQDAKWLLKNAKKVPGRKVIVGSNMLGFDKYFARDSSWIVWVYVRYPERFAKDWDYYVTYSRYIDPVQLQNNIWPPKNALYEVKVNDVALSAVLPRPSKASLVALAAADKNDVVTAAQQFGIYVQAEPYDENAWASYASALAAMGQMDGAAVAMNKAIQLHPNNPKFYEMLASVLNAKGDRQGAEQAIRTANSIIMQMQEQSE